MDALITSIRGLLNAAGGGLAVVFIILLAAGILAMTLVYVGSALLVLDRFARVSKGWLRPVLAAVCVVFVVALLQTVGSIPSDSAYSWAEWRSVCFRKRRELKRILRAFWRWRRWT